MLDLKQLEDNPTLVKEKLSTRSFDLKKIEQIESLNQERKSLLKIVEQGRAEIKKISKEVGELKKAKKDASDLMKQVESIKNEIKNSEDKLSTIQNDLNQQLLEVPNQPANDVPTGSSEEDNKEIYRWGSPRQFDFPVLDHTDLGEKLALLDFEVAAKLTGSRFAVLKGNLARLERAIANFMIDFHLQNNYLEIMPPYIVHQRSLIGTGNLPKFADDLFHLSNTDWYLIPTAEVPLTNLKREQLFSAEELPLQYVAYTPCFRSEAGSYGKDTRGLIRMHQFHKVEMVCITSAEQSDEIHQQMIQSAQKILELLNLPYRSLVLCTGDMGFSAQKTIDLEVWLPAQKTYREISSISNCGEFQARRAQIRYRGADGKPQFAHTLNGSGLAVGRTLVAIMENYQQADGSIEVPEVLQPYMGGLQRIS